MLAGVGLVCLSQGLFEWKGGWMDEGTSFFEGQTWFQFAKETGSPQPKQTTAILGYLQLVAEQDFCLRSVKRMSFSHKKIKKSIKPRHIFGMEKLFSYRETRSFGNKLVANRRTLQFYRSSFAPKNKTESMVAYSQA